MELLSVRAAFRRYRSSALLGGVDFFGYGGSIVCHDGVPALGRSLIPFMFYEWHRHEEGTADGRCSRQRRNAKVSNHVKKSAQTANEQLPMFDDGKDDDR